MSKSEKSLTGTKLEVTLNEQANLALPTWLPEAILVGQYWQSRGLLARLQQQVQVSRGRMGHYEVCDFVLLLLAVRRQLKSPLDDNYPDLLSRAISRC
jgi:hypothetical protein